jgi:hypothetical protein
MAQIYGLYSTRDGIVRYVGQTGGAREDRFKEHERARTGPLRRWFWNEWKHGFPVQSALLQYCNYEEREELETEWISRFGNLLNKQKVLYRGGAPQKIPEIEVHMRGHRFNVSGYRGIHRQVDRDRYCVLVLNTRSHYQHPSGPRWLLHDRSRWFPDLATALDARDRHRQYAPEKYWLPDVTP